jgi:hypothetical protein
VHPRVLVLLADVPLQPILELAAELHAAVCACVVVRPVPVGRYALAARSSVHLQRETIAAQTPY